MLCNFLSQCDDTRAAPTNVHSLYSNCWCLAVCRLFIISSPNRCVRRRPWPIAIERASTAVARAITFRCFYGTNFPIMYLNYEWKLTKNESMPLGVRLKTQQQKFFPKKKFFFYSFLSHSNFGWHPKAHDARRRQTISIRFVLVPLHEGGRQCRCRVLFSSK